MDISFCFIVEWKLMMRFHPDQIQFKLELESMVRAQNQQQKLDHDIMSAFVIFYH